MPLVLLVPGLLDVDATALNACAPLARVAARSTGERVDDAEAELLRALGVVAASAPLAALGAGLDVGSDWYARADPVTSLVGHDDVRIVARVDDLGADEAEALRGLLEAHFAVDELAFVVPRRDAWFVRSAAPHDVAFVPLDAAVGRPLRTRLPSGADAKRWRRWLTEVQMLLHDRPIAARERSPVDALWFSGGGTLPAPRPSAFSAHASATRHGDVLRGLARVHGCEAAGLAHVRKGLASAHAIVADPVTAETVSALAATLVEPALSALDGGRVDRLVLIAEGRDGAARWSLQRAGFLDRLRRRATPFTIPADDHA